MRTLIVKDHALTESTAGRLDGEPWDRTRLERFCRDNPQLNVELDGGGNVVVMGPANAEADGRNSLFLAAFLNWALESGAGKPFGPSAGFTLPNGAVRRPDAALVRWDDWRRLTAREKRSFAPLCPCFVLELRSSQDDSLSDLQTKMEEYVANGVQLGWLVDPFTRRLYVYRMHRDPEIIRQPAHYQAGAELPGFSFDFSVLWNA